MKHTTQRLLALLLIPCLILGLFLATPKTAQAESQALSIYVGETLKNAFSNNVSRVTNSNPAVVEVSYNGNQISFKDQLFDSESKTWMSYELIHQRP